jgi:hypothetical protein
MSWDTQRYFLGKRIDKPVERFTEAAKNRKATKGLKDTLKILETKAAQAAARRDVKTWQKYNEAIKEFKESNDL